MNKTANAGHTPVMLAETLASLAPRDGGIYIDATLGAGGYARAILDSAECTVYGFDRDPRAIAEASAWAPAYGERLVLIEAPFAQMEEALAERGIAQVDGVVFDLGVSSMQLDEGERGFSFRYDGALSMRMDGARPDASDIVNQASIDDLKMIFRVYGEEKRASALARAVVRARADGALMTTKALADIIEAASPHRYAGHRNAGRGRAIHPATRVFQALRIFVNDELGQLARALVAAERLLVAGGRLVAVSFHSLEARIIKRFIADRSGAAHTRSRHQPLAAAPAPAFDLLFRGQKTPGPEELAANPRARSAGLRGAVRTGAIAHPPDLAFAGLPVLNLSKPITMMEIS